MYECSFGCKHTAQREDAVLTSNNNNNYRAPQCEPNNSALHLAVFMYVYVCVTLEKAIISHTMNKRTITCSSVTLRNVCMASHEVSWAPCVCILPRGYSDQWTK